MSATDDGQVTLNASGDGTITFNSGSTRIKKVISKITLICKFGTTSGIVTIFSNSDRVAEGPLAASVDIAGEGYELLPGRILKIVITKGPASTKVYATIYHERVEL